jgi:CRISPR-associated protein (TIGR02584 family)
MSRKSETRNSKLETVLFAVTGMSPAILTETVWALAHETPAIIPDRIVVVTTAAGRATIQRELFDAGVWDKLRAALASKIRVHPCSSVAQLRFGTTPDDIRVFTRADTRGRSVELEDIRTPADNEAAADFLLDQLRPFTENPDTQLICSLAGGRKTMGALLYACLSLIGRDTDRLTHVLVNEPFDNPGLQPRFYFPTTPPTAHRLETRNSKPEIRNSSAAKIELADVPFVPLRNLFPRELARPPGRFMNLVRQYRTVVEELSQPPRLEIDPDEKLVRVDRRPVPLPATAIALLDFLARRARNGQPPYLRYGEAVDDFKSFLTRWADGGYDAFNYRADASIKNLTRNCTDQDIRKLVNAIKTGLRTAGVPPTVATHLLPRRGHLGIRLSK